MTEREGLDPVTREIIKNYLESAADTMAVTVVRTARSLVVRDNMDFSTAIFNADGDQVAQGLTLPFHMGAMQPALDAVRAHFGDDIKPGDVFANNDPYEGASHLPDIFVFKPVFVNELLMGWTCVIAHQTDIGGRVAGGNACDNTEIYQEGLRLPPLKLYEEGQLNKAVWRIIEKNVRVPDKVLGDIQAQISALRQGERDVLRLVEEHGLENLKSYMTDIIDYTERLTRAEIEGLPDGSWEFTDYVDDDGFSPEPIAIKVRVTIEGDEVELDFTGTSPQAKGSINPNLAFTKSGGLRGPEVHHQPEHHGQRRLRAADQGRRRARLLRQPAATRRRWRRGGSAASGWPTRCWELWPRRCRTGFRGPGAAAR